MHRTHTDTQAADGVVLSSSCRPHRRAVSARAHADASTQTHARPRDDFARARFAHAIESSPSHSPENATDRWSRLATMLQSSGLDRHKILCAAHLLLAGSRSSIRFAFGGIVEEILIIRCHFRHLPPSPHSFRPTPGVCAVVVEPMWGQESREQASGMVGGTRTSSSPR